MMRNGVQSETDDVAPAIGIDLGTTYCCVGVWQRYKVEIITNDHGNRTTPSYVSFTNEERLVGDTAKDNAAMNPENTVYAVKRLIGRRFSDPEVQSDRKQWPFRVVSGENDRPKIAVKYKGKSKQFSAEEVSAMILAKMKQIAETYLGCTVKDAVVTVPAYFRDSQRRATRDAGVVAGLNVKRIIDEPTAAALAYGFDNFKEYAVPKNVLIFDLGGGTFDVSVVAVCSGHFEVKATTGDTHLGGEDFNTRLLNHFVAELKRKHKTDIGNHPRALRKLWSACEQAKRALSTSQATMVQVDSLPGGLDFSSKLTRQQFENLNIDLFLKCIDLVGSCLSDAKIEKSNIDNIVLVGGSSRIPKLQELLGNYFDGKPLHRNINPEEAVAHGAAIQAANLTGQGGAMFDDIVLVDVTPLSLGLQLDGDVMSVVVPRNTPIPVKKEGRFTTSEDYQTNIEFPIYEGERSQASNNNLLGEFKLSNVSPALKLEPQIDVCFQIDADGILNISAKERDTNRASAITITHDESWLRKEEIDRMIKDAKKFQANDKKIQRRTEARGELDHYVYSTRNIIIKNHKDVLFMPESKRQKVEDAIDEVINWLDDYQHPTVQASKAKLQNLKKICDPILTEIKKSKKQCGLFNVQVKVEQD